MNASITPLSLRDQGYPSPRQFGETVMDWREELALTLDALSTAERRMMMRDTVIATGGVWNVPPARQCGVGRIEILLGGICGFGDCVDEAIAEWVKAVFRTCVAADGAAA